MRAFVRSGPLRPGTSGAGFTLVELLVVLCVLALLAGIALPGLSAAKDKGRQGLCISNQRMIARALLMYEQDYAVFPFNRYTYGVPGHKWQALDCLGAYLGGPEVGPWGTSELRGLQIGEFPDAYVCPSASPEVFEHNLNYMYHACYWTNLAIRCNRGFGILYFYWPLGSPGDPKLMDDYRSGGSARFFGKVCPNYAERHWRSVYHPSADTVNNPNGMVFTGDTNNGPYVYPPGSFHAGEVVEPGAWSNSPGWGYVAGHLGFDRHRGKIVLGYVDGHARAFPEAELEDYSWFSIGETTGDFMLNYVGDDGCGGTLIHALPDAVCE
jgi:prepilin-type N-terminal cleavage/methylation domain-containing protein